MCVGIWELGLERSVYNKMRMVKPRIKVHPHVKYNEGMMWVFISDSSSFPKFSGEAGQGESGMEKVLQLELGRKWFSLPDNILSFQKVFLLYFRVTSFWGKNGRGQLDLPWFRGKTWIWISHTLNSLLAIQWWVSLILLTSSRTLILDPINLCSDRLPRLTLSCGKKNGLSYKQMRIYNQENSFSKN